MLNRTTIINDLISSNNYKSYLEIGTQYRNNFDKIVCNRKICVDPAKNDILYDYNMTSDDFFAQNIDKFDIIFIDGLHLANQVEKDILNSIEILNDNGSIVLHDTNPPTPFHSMENQNWSSKTPAGGNWNGTTWKTIFKLRKTCKDLIIYTHDCDWGVTVIQKGESELLDIENPYYEYYIFDKYRKQILNII